MDIGQRKYIVVKRAGNRYFTLANEINKAFGLPRGQLYGLFKRKGIAEVDEVFRRILKEECENKMKLFLWSVAQLKSKPIIRKPKQLVLCPIVKETSKTTSK